MSKIAFTIDKKISRKHTYITIKSDGSVLVKTNFMTSKKQIEHFILQKKHWIRKKQLQIQELRQVDHTKIYILGELHNRGDQTIEELDLLYKQKVIEIIPPLVHMWSQKMDLYPARIGFRKNKTLWGSCSGKNHLSFNTQLAKTPLGFIEYVVVHELAHIQHKNHSKAFWHLVCLHLEDYKIRKSIVKKKNYLNSLIN